MTRLIAAAVFIVAAAAPALACEWNKSAASGFSVDRRVAVRRSTARQAGATQPLLA